MPSSEAKTQRADNKSKKNPPQCGSYHCHVTLSWRTESDNNLVMCFSGFASSSQIGVDCIYTSQFSLVV